MWVFFGVAPTPALRDDTRQVLDLRLVSATDLKPSSGSARRNEAIQVNPPGAGADGNSGTHAVARRLLLLQADAAEWPP
jgi:hypothetical protein